MKYSWNGVKVLISGVNGFVGGNLSKKLVKNGADVFGLVRSRKLKTLLHYENIYKNITLIDGELCDFKLFNRIIAEEKINVIFHLAAQVEVGVGLKNPYVTFESNVRGTYTLLESARQNPDSVNAIVVASSDKAYGAYPKEEMHHKLYHLMPLQ